MKTPAFPNHRVGIGGETEKVWGVNIGTERSAQREVFEGPLVAEISPQGKKKKRPDTGRRCKSLNGKGVKPSKTWGGGKNELGHKHFSS